MSVKVKINNARISYASVFEPKSINGGDPKYSCQIIIPKYHPQLKEIQEAIKEAAKEKYASIMKGGKWPAKLKHPLRDGEEREGEEGYEETYEGNIFFNANSNRRPLVIHKNKDVLYEADGVLYSGCYCNFVVNFYPYDSNGNKGVAVGLSGVQFKADGEALAGGGASVDDFDEEEDYDDEATKLI